MHHFGNPHRHFHTSHTFHPFSLLLASVPAPTESYFCLSLHFLLFAETGVQALDVQHRQSERYTREYTWRISMSLCTPCDNPDVSWSRAHYSSHRNSTLNNAEIEHSLVQMSGIRFCVEISQELNRLVKRQHTDSDDLTESALQRVLIVCVDSWQL